MADFLTDYLMPGGEDFVDITHLVAAAGRDMEPEEILLQDGFTLMDAMSAFEIGEPRLDSGMLLDEQRRPQFDPFRLLLPEEVCWIMDRSFACEMDWHSGKTLAQSVFTLLYVHRVEDLDPDYFPLQAREDLRRPPALVSVVLRASIAGLLKSCDLAWRELSKNKLHDIEDWHSDKCEVSLLEGTPTAFVLQLLSNACEWLHISGLPPHLVKALYDRLHLRKIILQLYTLDGVDSLDKIHHLVDDARGTIRQLRFAPLPPLSPDSPASWALDSHIGRRLPNYMPIQVTELLTQEQTWDALFKFLDNWEELGKLLKTPSVLTWETVGNLSLALNKPVPPAFLRSTAQTRFFDRHTVLDSLPASWLIDHFFSETLGISYAVINDALHRTRPPQTNPSMKDVFERQIIKLMVARMRSGWCNPPRRRRLLMKSVLEWHTVYDMLLKETSACRPSDEATANVLSVVPRAALIYRLSASREIILSGFQQELYAPEEKPIAYWYLARILECHLDCIDNLIPLVPQDTIALKELLFQRDYLTALQMMSVALVQLTSVSISSPWTRIATNFVRRYKWAFDADFDGLVPAEPIPDLRAFRPALDEALQDGFYSSNAFGLARDIFSVLADSGHDWLGPWATDRCQHLRNLVNVCEGLCGKLATVQQGDSACGMLTWDVIVHPWFPIARK